MQIPFGFFDMFGFFLLVPMLIFIVIFVFVLKMICSASKSVGSFVTTMPTFQTQQSAPTRSDGSDIRTVRLPSKCPSCGAALSPEGIDWVGPMEAKCTYCGGVVHAKLERL